jgi:hypothetical protein
MLANYYEVTNSAVVKAVDKTVFDERHHDADSMFMVTVIEADNRELE